jgi:hypothetical protein
MWGNKINTVQTIGKVIYSRHFIEKKKKKRNKAAAVLLYIQL